MTVPASFFADGPGTRTIVGRIKDKDGGYTDYTTTITINNVTPVVNAGPDAAVNATQTFTQAGNFTDRRRYAVDGLCRLRLPSPATRSATLLAGFSGKNFTLSHVYSTPEMYDVRVYVEDKDGAIGTDE